MFKKTKNSKRNRSQNCSNNEFNFLTDSISSEDCNKNNISFKNLKKNGKTNKNETLKPKTFNQKNSEVNDEPIIKM
jgi:hypothetical protein